MPPKTVKLKNKPDKRPQPCRQLRSNSIADDQLSIVDSLKMAEKVATSGPADNDGKDSSVPKSTAATSEDIQLILKKLDSMDKHIKTQLTEIESRFSAKVQGVEDKLTSMFDMVKEDVEVNKTQIKEIKTTLSAVEASQSFQGDELKDVEKKLRDNFDEKLKDLESQHKTREAILMAKIGALENKNLDMEKHGRKYSILMYGVADKHKEDIYKTVKSILIEEVKLSEEVVSQMIFANIHRLPGRGGGNRPIIVKFVRFADKELVMSQVYAGVLPSWLRIVNDLPPKMKQERYQLEKKAYDFRHCPENYKTRIVEKGLRLELQIRKSEKESWEKAPV